MHDLISIVDDDPSVCRAVGTLVRSLGYPVRTFNSAEAFLDSDFARESACLISDVRMPGMSGLELQRHLIAMGIVLPLIFMAANPDPGMVRGALAAGAIAFHTKPFDGEKLAESIERAVSQKAA
jgi:FixJ family two-component response regulator